MAVEISDYIDIEQRMAELRVPPTEAVTILPTNFELAAAPSEFRVSGTAPTILKVLRHGGVSAQLLDARDLQPAFIHNKSHDWVVPVIFVSSELLKANPDLISITIDLIRDYAVSLFRGLGEKKCIKAEIVVEQKGGRTYKKLSYEGNVEGLRELAQIAREIYGRVED